MKRLNTLPWKKIGIWALLTYTLGTLFFSPWGGLLSRLASRGTVFMALILVTEGMFIVGLAMLAGSLRRTLISIEVLFIVGLLMLPLSLRLWLVSNAGWWSVMPAFLGIVEVCFGPGGGSTAKFRALMSWHEHFKKLLVRARQSWLCRIGFVVNAVGAFGTGMVVMVGPWLIVPWVTAVPYSILGAVDLWATIKVRSYALRASRAPGTVGG